MQEKKWDSPYKDWFHISFDGNTNYNDGLVQEPGRAARMSWFKLNLQHPDVKNYLFDAVRNWVRDYDIDGLRLDVPTAWTWAFTQESCAAWANSIAGFRPGGRDPARDYNRWMNDHACHSVTNYECCRGCIPASTPATCTRSATA